MDRLRKRLDSDLTGPVQSLEKHREEGKCTIRETQNKNMTPSSLLLLQSHNYIEQQQRAVTYHDTGRCAQDEGANLIQRAAGQSSAIANIVSTGGDDGGNRHQVSCLDAAPSPSSSSSHMSSGVNHYKGLDGQCNPSSESGGSCGGSVVTPALSTNVIDSNEYPPSQN